MLFILTILTGLAISAPQYAAEVARDKARLTSAIEQGDVEKAKQFQKEIETGSNLVKTNEELFKDRKSLKAARSVGNDQLVAQYEKEIKAHDRQLYKQKDSLEKVVEGNDYARNELKRDRNELKAAVKKGDTQKAMNLQKEIKVASTVVSKQNLATKAIADGDVEKAIKMSNQAKAAQRKL